MSSDTYCPKWFRKCQLDANGNCKTCIINKLATKLHDTAYYVIVVQGGFCVYNQGLWPVEPQLVCSMIRDTTYIVPGNEWILNGIEV